MESEKFNEFLEKESAHLKEELIDTLAPNANDKEKGELRKKIEEKLFSRQSVDRFSSGFDLFIAEIENLPPVVAQQIRQECEKGFERLSLMSQQQFNSIETLAQALENVPNSLQELLNFSDELIEQFYQSGLRYYQSGYFRESGDIFFTLSILSPMRANVWLALGLAEKQMVHYEDALKAFAMAALLDESSPVALILSAECYQILHDNKNMKSTLDYALEMINEHPSEESSKYKAHIHFLSKKE